MMQQKGKNKSKSDNPSILFKRTCDIPQVALDASLQAFMRLTKLLVYV